MVKLLKRKPVKVNESLAFYLPKSFVDNGIISVDKEYDIEIVEASNDE